MPHISRDDIFKVVITSLLSLLAYIGSSMQSSQADIVCRMRLMEIQQARIMERLGIEASAEPASSPRRASQISP